MSQLIACPECKKHLQVPDDLIGKKVQCPECKHTFTATAPEVEEISAKTKISTPKAPSTSAKTPAWDKKSKDDDDDEPRRSSKKKRADDDDADDDDRPRRRSRRRSSRGDFVPHRGGMILAFGIIGLVAMPILGVVAWVLGNSDLREIHAGRMDPEGESMTNTGRILGMVGTILWIVGVVFGCGGYFCCIAFFIGAGAAANKGMPPPRKF